MVKNLTAVVASCRWSGADNVKPRPGEKRPCRGGMHAVINDRAPPSCGCGFTVAAGRYCTAGAVSRTAAKCYGARFRSWVFVLVSGSNVLNSLTPTIVISPCQSVLSYPVSLQHAYTHPRPMLQKCAACFPRPTRRRKTGRISKLHRRTWVGALFQRDANEI